MSSLSQSVSQLLGQLLARYLSVAAVTLVALSEALILQWTRLATGRPALGPGEFVLAILGLAALNLVLMTALRRRRRRGLAGQAASRAFMMGSVAALFSGPLLLGVFTAVGVPLLAVELLHGPAPLGQALLIAGGGLAIAVGFGSIAWGYLVGQRRITVERLDLPLPGVTPALAGLRVVHITDLHIGPHLPPARLRRFVDRVNAVDADLLVITGDIFDFDPAWVDDGCRELSRLRARHGVFAVLGNHDIYTGADTVVSGLARFTSIQLLRDAWVRLEIDGDPLYLLGIDDPGRDWTTRHMRSPALERLAAEVPADAARILLMHRPTYFSQVVELGLPVALAGHTHGGQVALPPPAQHHNISRLLSEWTRGLFREGDSLLYVNRGLGVAGLPIRLNCTREIAVFSLVPRLGGLSAREARLAVRRATPEAPS